MGYLRYSKNVTLPVSEFFPFGIDSHPETEPKTNSQEARRVTPRAISEAMTSAS